LVRKPEGNKPFIRPRRRWEDNIRFAVREIVWEGVDWLRIWTVAGPSEHGNEPSGSIKGGEFLD
jgi:hypothetical protein